MLHYVVSCALQLMAELLQTADAGARWAGIRAPTERSLASVESDGCLGDAECDAYADAVKTRLSVVLEERTAASTWEDVCSQMHGAFPNLMYETARAIGFAADPDFLRGSHVGSRQLSPELHPLDFEWYFTPECATRIARELARISHSAVFVGAPTLAREAASLGMHVTLIDANPLLARRFTGLALNVNLYLDGIAQSASRINGSEIVFFDAPWYLGDVLEWLEYAVSGAREGALIAFPLFPPLTRPSARTERNVILDAARRAGSVAILQDALRYETPLFEAESIRASGLPSCGNWRLADLVLVRRAKAEPRFPRAFSGGVARASWETFVIGSQVVKLRRRAEREPWCTASVSPVPGRDEYVYGSVSARDPARPCIDIWTSRNRVAAVAGIDAVREILTQLECGASLDAAVASALGFATSSQSVALARQLSDFLVFDASNGV